MIMKYGRRDIMSNLIAGQVMYMVPENFVDADAKPQPGMITKIDMDNDVVSGRFMDKDTGRIDGDFTFQSDDIGQKWFQTKDSCEDRIRHEKLEFHAGLKEWEHETGQDEPTDEDLQAMEADYKKSQSSDFGIDFTKAAVRDDKESVLSKEQAAETQRILSDKQDLSKSTDRRIPDISTLSGSEDNVSRELE